MSKPDEVINPDILAIGTPMREGAGHALKNSPVDGRAIKTQKSGYSAHDPTSERKSVVDDWSVFRYVVISFIDNSSVAAPGYHGVEEQRAAKAPLP